MSKNLINTVVSTVKNFISGGYTTPKMEIPDNSEYLKAMYSDSPTFSETLDKYFKTLAIPALEAGERKVLSVNIGKLLRSDYVAFTTFYSRSFAPEESADLVTMNDANGSIVVFDRLSGMRYVPGISTDMDYLIIPFDGKINDDIRIIPKDFGVNGPSATHHISHLIVSSLIATYDYKKCCRPRFGNSSSIFSNVEKCNANDLLFNDRTNNLEHYRSQPPTYENLGKGCIFGWYVNAGTGVFFLNKKIIMESAWLELLTDGTTELKISLKNFDSTTSAVASRKIFFYNI